MLDDEARLARELAAAQHDRAELPDRSPRRHRTRERPTLDERGAGDSDQAWGDHEADEDAWLKEQKPPHW